VRAVRAGVERTWRRVDAAAWASSGRLGLLLIALSCALTIGVAALGPSSVTLNVGPASGLLPPWFIPAEAGKGLGLPPSEWLVVPVLWVGIVAGGLGLWVASRAVAAGWRPGVRRLFAVGAGLSLATACVPPLTSADVLMYAAYGRLQRLGLDPYALSPADVFRQAYDPVLVWTERPWQDTPSVYGPIASASQLLANLLGGESMHDIVFWLQVACVVPFIVVGAVVVKLAHGDEARQTRAVLFTVANPLLVWAVVAGAHNEALTLVFAICALAFVRRSPFVTGVFIGLAGAVKVSLVFYGLALVWGYRREPRKLLSLVAGAAVPLVVAYGLVAPQALFAASRNLGYISQGSWGLPVVFVLEPVLGGEAARGVVTKLGWVLLVVIAWMLSRVLDWEPVPGARVPARDDALTIAVRTALVLCTAWVITTPWSLPWYDLIAWAPLALVARNRLSTLLIWRGAALSVAHVTARSVQFGASMQWATWLLREVLCSVVAVGVLAAVVAWWWDGGHELPTRDFVRRGWMRLRRADA